MLLSETILATLTLTIALLGAYATMLYAFEIRHRMITEHIAIYKMNHELERRFFRHLRDEHKLDLDDANVLREYGFFIPSTIRPQFMAKYNPLIGKRIYEYRPIDPLESDSAGGSCQPESEKP